MEIINDVTRAVNIPAGSVRGATAQKTVQTSASSDTVSNSSRRELLNAMNIMQTASGIVQEALTASSKLRSIAMSAMITGRTDFSAVTETLSGIQTSLQENGRPIAAPIITEKKDQLSEMPDISAEVAVLKNMADKGVVDNEKIKTAEESLNKKNTELMTRIEKMGYEYGSKKFSYSYEPSTDNQVSQMITNQHDTAILAQGNIRADVVSHLLK